MNKKGFTVSITMIVVLILALVTLGVAIGFITGFLGQLTDSVEGFPILEIEPTADNPISFIPATVERGQQAKMSIGFYNDQVSEVSSDNVPQIVCNGIAQVDVVASGLTIPVGDTGDYSALVTVPSNTPSQKYSCTMTISETQETFFLEVK